MGFVDGITGIVVVIIVAGGFVIIVDGGMIKVVGKIGIEVGGGDIIAEDILFIIDEGILGGFVEDTGIGIVVGIIVGIFV